MKKSTVYKIKLAMCLIQGFFIVVSTIFSDTPNLARVTAIFTMIALVITDMGLFFNLKDKQHATILIESFSIGWLLSNLLAGSERKTDLYAVIFYITVIGIFSLMLWRSASKQEKSKL